MRSRLPFSLIAPLAFLVPLACGGGTPAPKDSDEVASKAPAAGDKETAPAESSETPAASEPAASSPPKAAPAPAAETGLALPPSSDDPFLAHHQMPAAQLKGTMRGAQGKVQACYRAGLKRDKSTFGDVKIRFVVSNDGDVKATRDEGSSMSDEEVTKCIAELIKTLKFPKQKSPGDAYGIYSIHLAP